MCLHIPLPICTVSGRSCSFRSSILGKVTICVECTEETIHRVVGGGAKTLLLCNLENVRDDVHIVKWFPSAFGISNPLNFQFQSKLLLLPQAVLRNSLGFSVAFNTVDLVRLDHGFDDTPGPGR